MGQPFDQAVDEADISIRLSGPLTWVSTDTIADAAATYPWIAVPVEGIRKVGRITCSAQGIFVVENSEAFEKVCLLDDITERWLCVWNQGNPSKRLMRFLADLNLPIAAWCDLDAYGIRMIHNMQAEIGKTILPVGMSVDLWRAGTKLDQSDQQLAKARTLASRMAAEGPPALRDLAVAIAETGDLLRTGDPLPACPSLTAHGTPAAGIHVIRRSVGAAPPAFPGMRPSPWQEARVS